LDTVGTDFAGRNYGYPIYEGACLHGSETRCPTSSDSTFVEPFHWYAHRGTEDGGCVSGAVSLWSNMIKSLICKIIYGADPGDCSIRFMSQPSYSGRPSTNFCLRILYSRKYTH
jgi:hypothetical protein